MDVGLYFEEYTEDWSCETAPAEITDDDITTFVRLARFNTPTYTNAAYAQASYGGRMAPGMLVLSIAEGLALNAGITRRRGIFLMELTPRFRSPVFAGDTIVNRIRLKSKKPTSKPDRGVVVTAHEVVTGKGDVAITYDSVRMIRTRLYEEPSGQSPRPAQAG